MTTFLSPDEATNVDFAESRQKRDRDRVACFLHLRDLVYLHREAASASTIAFVQTLETAVIAEKDAREKRLADARKRDAERRQEADRQKAAAERAKAEQEKTEQEKTEQATADNGGAQCKHAYGLRARRTGIG